MILGNTFFPGDYIYGEYDYRKTGYCLVLYVDVFNFGNGREPGMMLLTPDGFRSLPLIRDHWHLIAH